LIARLFRSALPVLAVSSTSNLFTAPIRDRIDINQAFLPLRRAYLKTTLQRTASSAAVAERVLEARDRQRRRLAGSGWQTNGEVSGTYLRRLLPLPDGLQSIDEAVDRGRLSAAA
jgi:magnesium chelatase family protein